MCKYGWQTPQVTVSMVDIRHLLRSMVKYNLLRAVVYESCIRWCEQFLNLHVDYITFFELCIYFSFDIVCVFMSQLRPLCFVLFALVVLGLVSSVGLPRQEIGWKKNVSETGWQWRNFVPHLCRLVFAAIVSVKLLEMFVTLLSVKYALSVG